MENKPLSEQYWLCFYISGTYDEWHMEAFTVEEAIEEVNRDRSDQWEDYDQNDWIEGMDTFTDYIAIAEIDKAQYEEIKGRQISVANVHHRTFEPSKVRVNELLRTLADYHRLMGAK